MSRTGGYRRSVYALRNSKSLVNRSRRGCVPWLVAHGKIVSRPCSTYKRAVNRWCCVLSPLQGLFALLFNNPGRCPGLSSVGLTALTDENAHTAVPHGGIRLRHQRPHARSTATLKFLQRACASLSWRNNGLRGAAGLYEWLGTPIPREA